MAGYTAYRVYQGAWIGLPTPPLPPPPPPPGLVKPDGTNTGTSGPLTVRNGNQYLTTPGTVLDSLDIHGFVTVYAANCIIRNCRIRGNGIQNVTQAGTVIQDSALIDGNPQGCRNLLVTDCELAHDFPSVWVDGVLGHDYTARRCNIHSVVDGFGAYNNNTGHKTDPLNIVIASNWVHDLNYMSPDPEIYDNHTHNDGIQIQGSGGMQIIGNNLQDLAGPNSNTRSPYFPAMTGQAIGFTPNVSTISNVIIDQNWLDGGAQPITARAQFTGTTLTFTVDGATTKITKNRFGRKMPDGITLSYPSLTKSGVKAQRPIYVIDPVIALAGFSTSTSPNGTLDTVNGNVYDDDGTPVRIFVGV